MFRRYPLARWCNSTGARRERTSIRVENRGQVYLANATVQQNPVVGTLPSKQQIHEVNRIRQRVMILFHLRIGHEGKSGIVQLVGNAFLAPRPIRRGHRRDQPLHVRWNRWAAWRT